MGRPIGRLSMLRFLDVVIMVAVLASAGAMAGFGTCVLLLEWMAGDSEPTSFWEHGCWKQVEASERQLRPVFAARL